MTPRSLRLVSWSGGILRLCSDVGHTRHRCTCPRQGQFALLAVRGDPSPASCSTSSYLPPSAAEQRGHREPVLSAIRCTASLGSFLYPARFLIQSRIASWSRRAIRHRCFVSTSCFA